MRDIRAGNDINVAGDLIVHDYSQEGSLLVNCTSEFLSKIEEPHRKVLLKGEQKGKVNTFVTTLAVAASFIFGAAVWYWLSGKMDAFALVAGVAGFLVALASLRIYEQPTEFELRQVEALKEIKMILRERGVRE
jgi:hypothetical protein